MAIDAILWKVSWKSHAGFMVDYRDLQVPTRKLAESSEWSYDMLAQPPSTEIPQDIVPLRNEVDPCQPHPRST